MREYVVVETKEGPKSVDLRVSIGKGASKREIEDIANHLNTTEYAEKNQVMIMFFDSEENAKREKFNSDNRYCTYYNIKGAGKVDWRWDRQL